uniref:Uncharacterized protein n=1 Tax=Romanomermis culicivorax TaxID=13658 RepID=A0A915KYJ1_ROMCU
MHIHPYLWSKADRSYKDTIKHWNAWISIGTKLNIDAEEISTDNNGSEIHCSIALFINFVVLNIQVINGDNLWIIALVNNDQPDDIVYNAAPIGHPFTHWSSIQ